jgi:hypothetical protein
MICFLADAFTLIVARNCRFDSKYAFSPMSRQTCVGFSNAYRFLT